MLQKNYISNKDVLFCLLSIKESWD